MVGLLEFCFRDEAPHQRVFGVDWGKRLEVEPASFTGSESRVEEEPCPLANAPSSSLV